MKKKILTIILGIALFIPTIKASNDNPKVVSELLKDGSLDFNVKLSDMNLETSKEYEWSLVENQAAIPEDNAWTTVNNWTNNTMEIYLNFSDNPYRANNIQKVISKVDTAYLIIREKESKAVISEYIKTDVSIPYAYGAVPYYTINDKNETLWSQHELLSMCMTCGSTRKFTAIKITDKNIIDGFLKLKDSNGEIEELKLAEYVDSLDLTSIPSTFKKTTDNSYYSLGSDYNIHSY